MFQEYPKALYKGGQTGDMVVVEDKAEEAAARKDGFTALTDKPGKPAGGTTSGG